jgi:hypothetical protein
MKKIFTILTIVLLASVANAQSIDCKKFKNGKFYYPMNDGKLSVRKDTIQESYNNGKLEMVWKIKWLSDCEYEMTCIKILVDPYPIKVGDRIIAKIIKTDGDCVTVSSTMYNASNPQGFSAPDGHMCLKKD